VPEDERDEERNYFEQFRRANPTDEASLIALQNLIAHEMARIKIHLNRVTTAQKVAEAQILGAPDDRGPDGGGKLGEIRRLMAAMQAQTLTMIEQAKLELRTDISSSSTKRDLSFALKAIQLVLGLALAVASGVIVAKFGH